jgi:hypothetical protein
MNQRSIGPSTFAAALAALACAATAQASFTINVNFTGGLTPSQQAIFSTAASTWQGLVTGYRPGISITGININAAGNAIDGVGGILGSAGPSSGVTQAGFFLSTAGNMTFDTADLANLEANGTLLPVILHEMAHVMGFGTLWTNNGVYTNGTGAFTGAAALAAYQVEYSQPGATSVPVELGGGSGTANAHWDEVDGGGSNTGIVSGAGDRRFELMTGWLNSPYYISQTTLGSFFDIGFTVVPTPSAAVLLGAGVLTLGRRRR